MTVARCPEETSGHRATARFRPTSGAAPARAPAPGRDLVAPGSGTEAAGEWAWVPGRARVPVRDADGRVPDRAERGRVRAAPAPGRAVRGRVRAAPAPGRAVRVRVARVPGPARAPAPESDPVLGSDPVPGSAPVRAAVPAVRDRGTDASSCPPAIRCVGPGLVPRVPGAPIGTHPVAGHRQDRVGHGPPGNYPVGCAAPRSAAAAAASPGSGLASTGMSVEVRYPAGPWTPGPGRSRRHR
ncbi:hypothetical protein MBT84_36590 [Streptomyces sp. MBT84]|nr:hypothetical protein [Streptomyces sp. MBT84]